MTRLGPNGEPVPVGAVVATRDTPGGLEVTIKLRDNAEGAETAAEIADGYRPAVDVVLQPLSSEPATFKPRARVHALALSTLADPGDDGRVLSIDGHPLGPPELADPRSSTPVKPPVIVAAEELLMQAGQGSSWWASVS